MDRIELSRVNRLAGDLVPPPDKSVSHRALMLASLADGTSRIRNLLSAEDTRSTASAFRALGIEIEENGDTAVVKGRGLHGLSEPSDVIDCGNSGTTIRLLSGVLAGNPFFSVLTGDDSLRKRPMARVIQPLSLMGADIRARQENRLPPLSIQGRRLNPLTYTLPVASAQVKSSLLLAGLYADGDTVLTEPARSRDHTERMLSALGVNLQVRGLTVQVRGNASLSSFEMEVPGDFSSAAFFMVAASVVRGSEVVLRNTGINPTRTGLIGVLRAMGADIEVCREREVSGEPVADIVVRGVDRLRAVDVRGDVIPSLIDEFPALCVAASLAEGTTTIRDASELRVKESDRIAAMASELGKMGVRAEEFPDGIDITGSETLTGAGVESHGDHRIAMSMAVAALRADGTTVINGVSAVSISFPGFFDSLRKLAAPG